MRNSIGVLLGVVSIVGPLAAASAQPSATAFDGTYALLSAKKVNETYTARSGQLGECPDRAAGPLTISGGRAEYTSETGNHLTGTVGPQGQLQMGSISPPNSGGAWRPVEVNVNGNVAVNGYARARQIGNSCSYDFLWQREAK